MMNRKEFIKTGLAGAGAMALASESIAAKIKGAKQKSTTRFIFIHKGNGLLPQSLTLPSFTKEEKVSDTKKEPLDIDIRKHDLPKWMEPLSEFKEDLTILQGVSGKMCTTGHHTWCSSLGAYKANERISSIKWATVDFELAKLFPSPMEHIELACFPTGGGNSRGNINGIEKGFSARGVQQPNYAFGSPKVALRELFKSVSQDKGDQINYQLERKVLEFISKNHAPLLGDLKGLEKNKIFHYKESVDAIRLRNQKVDSMSERILKNIPELDEKYLNDDLNTVERQEGHVEILLSSLISGLSNVVTFTVDELGTPYTGLPGIEKEKVNLHDVGHGKSAGGVKAIDVREKVRHQHMKLINTIVKRLKDTPENDGTMFDNTVLFYFPENGETHHSHGTEYPFVILAGKNSKLKKRGCYLRLPKYGDVGHKTLGNLWTTVLNAYGNPIEHFGDFDLSLKGDQSGVIKELM